MIQSPAKHIDTWTPVLKEGDLKENIISILQDIEPALGANLNLQNIPSLFFGNLSAALFYTGWHKYNPTSDLKEIQKKIYQLVENSIELINTSENISISYVEGINGIAWAYNHLLINGLLDDEIEECLADFDEIIFSALNNNIQSGDLDLFYGICGNLNYLVERHANKKIAPTIIPDALEQIHTLLFNPNDGFITNHHSYEIVLGFAHGYASILSVLCKVAKVDAELKDYCQSFFIEVYNFYKQFKQGTEKNFTYPNLVDQGKVENLSPIRWCHGEMGPAIAFAMGGAVFNLDYLTREAIETGLKTVKRSNPEQEDIHEFGVCHGAGGNAHLYARLYNYTGEKAFAEASEHWLKEAVKMANHENGLAGFKVLSPKGEYVNSINFLNGISGLGLVFMAAVSENPPTWDKCIMLS